jgi:hypothetical protein
MVTLLTLAPLYAGLAFADPEPSAPVTVGNSTVTTEVLIQADAASIRAALADPLTACRLSGDVLSATVLAKEGDCSILRVTTRGLSAPLTYTTRRCPTADGFRETLVTTEDFDNQTSSWKLTPVSGGTVVTLAVRSEPRLPLPQRMINAAVGSSAVQTLRNLVHRVTGR